jgi:hypothetical protein
MAQLCPTCNTQNPDSSVRCIRCGTGLASTVRQREAAKANNFFSYSNQQATTQQSQNLHPNDQGYSILQTMAQQSQNLHPNDQGYSIRQTMTQQSQHPYPDSQGYGNRQQLTAQQSQNLYPAPSQMGTAVSGLNQLKYRRAFAGYGTAIMHHSWLLHGKDVQATTLHTTIMELLRQRNFVGIKLSTSKLQEKGYHMEERDYIIAQRGVSSVFVYVAPAGRDLYISRATSVLQSIDFFRAVTLVALLLLALLGPGVLPGILAGGNTPANTSGYSGSTSASPLSGILVPILSLVSVIIWLYLIRWTFRSFKHWLVEKDFWAYLRMRELNDFQIDDIALLEHSTDETVRAAVEQLNLDGNKIVPPASYKPERHIQVV